MSWRILGAVALAALLLPQPALAAHLSQYAWNPLTHDMMGMSFEPDGASTAVLGPTVRNCVIATAGACNDALAGGRVVAPGCTGPGGRAVDGQCGLWTVGAKPNSITVVPTGTVPAPLSVQGAGRGHGPGILGRFTLVDGVLDSEHGQNPVTGGPVRVLGLQRLLQEAGMNAQVLPGQNMVWAWYGDFEDLNGNGVIDACHQTCSAAMANEFVWRGSCTEFAGGYNGDYAEAHGFCKQAPNPNVDGSHACAPAEEGPCANAHIAAWYFPGNHHGYALGDLPGRQVVRWVTRGFDCDTPPTCDDEAREVAGDPLLDDPHEVNADAVLADRSGDNGPNNVGDDTARMWVGHLGAIQPAYGDDGLLGTLVAVYGVDCAAAPGLPQGFDLATPVGTPGGCGLVDVDLYPSLHPAFEGLLSAAKAAARSAWLVVRAAV